ncbi:50S ribosomal protein L23 [Candidatus Gottesmanbacteria bacterium RIFCSPHIGHO2_02_FULL_39_11]|uniref:Large ribosomal subunit protein uL23 n=1 Tax=Candidatus Gottesmanbacteria bacterium RIFCSPHIGHO2_02_FULL_39_11 TaxID=1798382 RepID=A0A1F5ZWU9_9BACT|nr:MAG: 50S ribosomal protein L23 [Candidatus Gottesmanbacteria bacterium RIFCSPHIGHO2_02_FULL_39_11]
MENIIIRPIITEHALGDAQKGVFTFEVAKTATKGNIQSAIKKLFNVHVVAIATSIQKGKTKRVGKLRKQKDTADTKKARVTLKKGETIEYFEVRKS